MNDSNIKKDINNIIDRLDRLRVERGLSQYQLAKLADFSHNTLHNIFLRKACPSLETLLRLCSAMNITLCDFFSYTKQQRDLDTDASFYELLPLISKESLTALLGIMKVLK